MKYLIQFKSSEPLHYFIKIKKVDSRLRAILTDSSGYEIASWWLTNATGTKRYKPFKPAPRFISEILLNRVPTPELQRLWIYMYQVEDGDIIEIKSYEEKEQQEIVSEADEIEAVYDALTALIEALRSYDSGDYQGFKESVEKAKQLLQIIRG